MIKSKLYTLLREYLGEYLYGLQEDQLDVALLSGKVNFSNANFRPDKVNSLFSDLALPCTLKAGLIGSLQVQYHYSSFLSNPVTVTIDNLILVLGPLPCQVFEPDTRYMKSSLADDNIPSDQIFLKRFAQDKHKAHEDSVASCEMSEDDGEDEFISLQDSPTEKQKKPGSLAELVEIAGEKEGLMGKYFSKVMKNLSLKVTNVHIRYEDDTYPFVYPFSAGISLQSLTVSTVPMEWTFSSNDSSDVVKQRPRNGAIVKEVAVTQLSVYLLPVSSMLIPTSLWEATQSSPIGIFDALPAYEVKEIALQESALISKSPSSLLSPITTSFTLTLSTQPPRLKLCLSLSSPISLHITAAMVDTIRGFWDYYISVQMWPYMRRYRPFERMLLIHRAPDEPEFVSIKRKRIVRKWFIYACRFIQAKRKIVELAKKRQEQVKKEKERKRKEERYVRRAEKGVDGSFGLDESGWRDDSMDPAVTLPKNVKKTLSFLIVKPKRVPGTATSSLSAAIYEYNRNIPTSPIAKEVRPPKPSLPTQYFPPPWDSFQFDLRTEALSVHFTDETHIGTFNMDRISLNGSIEEGKMTQTGSITRLLVTVGEGNETTTLLTVGKNEVRKEEILKNGLFGRGQKRQVVVEKAERGVEFRAEYRPGAFKAEGEAYPTTRMYDITSTLGSISLSYSHTSLIQVIELLSSYRPLRPPVPEEETTLQLDKPHLLPKSRRPHKPRSALITFLSHLLANRTIRLKSHLPDLVSDADAFISPIDFSLKVDFGGLNLALNSEEMGESISDWQLPIGRLELEKTGERLKTMMWGFGVTVNSSLMRVLEFGEVISRQKLSEFVVKEKKVQIEG